MSRRQLQLEYARAVNTAWYVKCGHRRNGITLEGRYPRRRWVITVVKRFPKPRAYPVNRRNPTRVHIPRVGVILWTRGYPFAYKVEFWCGQATHHPELTDSSPTEDLCRLCMCKAFYGWHT